MTILAHLTGTDLGLVLALFFAAALLAALGARWIERIRE
jgi:hypothetical protein